VTVFFFQYSKNRPEGRLFELLHKVMNVVHITAMLFKDGRLLITAFLVAFLHLWILWQGPHLLEVWGSTANFIAESHPEKPCNFHWRVSSLWEILSVCDMPVQ